MENPIQQKCKLKFSEYFPIMEINKHFVSRTSPKIIAASSGVKSMAWPEFSFKSGYFKICE